MIMSVATPHKQPRLTQIFNFSQRSKRRTSHHHRAMSADSDSDDAAYGKEANPYPRYCKQCNPLLSDEIRRDLSLGNRTREELINRIEKLRVKIRNQRVRLRHLDHELYDLQTAKDTIADDADRAIDQEAKLGGRLEEFGLHPDKKARKATMQEQDFDTANSTKFELTEEDIDAINDINITLRIRRYGSRRGGNTQIGTFFQNVSAIQLSTSDLTSYYDLANTVLRMANTLSVNMNVVLTVEMLPKMSEKTYHRVLHPGQFAVWMQGMKVVRGGDYEIVAYLYTIDQAEGAVRKLELEADILKY